MATVLGFTAAGKGEMRHRKYAIREYCGNKPQDNEIGGTVHFDRRSRNALQSSDRQLLALEKAELQRREARNKVKAICVSVFRGIATLVVGTAIMILLLELVNAYVWPLW